jgi:DNA-binding response OmpR family regulator
MTSFGKVLIIDDEDSLRTTLVRVLQRAGCEVTSAANGKDGLRRLFETEIDLVYLDIRLPEMDGLEVLQEIRKLNSQLPVILFTGHATLKTALDAIRLGATDYLVKPIDPEVLVARTRVILDEQAFERRRREIRDQIASLQSELRALESNLTQPTSSTFPASFPEDRFIKRGPFILDLQAQRATFGERVLSIPPTAFQYLAVLIRHAPEAVDYQTLAAEAQGYEVVKSEASGLAKYHIHVLRQILDVRQEQPGYILNVRGIGYRILTD